MMSSTVKELEGLALPALDALTKSVTTANLERVRKVGRNLKSNGVDCCRYERVATSCMRLASEFLRFSRPPLHCQLNRILEAERLLCFNKALSEDLDLKIPLAVFAGQDASPASADPRGGHA